MNEKLKAGLGIAAGLSFLGGASLAEASPTEAPQAHEVELTADEVALYSAVGHLPTGEVCTVYDFVNNVCKKTEDDGQGGGNSGGNSGGGNSGGSGNNGGNTGGGSSGGGNSGGGNSGGSSSTGSQGSSSTSSSSSSNRPNTTQAPQLSYEGRMARDHGPECAYDWETDTPWGPYFADAETAPEGFDAGNVTNLLAHPEYWTPQNVTNLLGQAEGWLDTETGEAGVGSHELTRFYEVCGTGGFIDGNRWVNGFGLTAQAYEDILAETGHPPTLLNALFVVDEEGRVTFSGEQVLLSQQRLIEIHVSDTWEKFSDKSGVDAREFAASGGVSLADLVASQQVGS